ncbi:MAG: hypothetical protein WD716_09340 [Fimbriimonadaceae bacterium]
MPQSRPKLANIAEQIGHQVLLLRQDATAETDLQTVRARLEAIMNFASMGLSIIEEGQPDALPKPVRRAAVK